LLVKEVGNGTTLVDEEVLESFDGLSLLLSLDVLFFVVGLLDFAPVLLDGKGLLFVFEGDGVVFKGLVGTLDDSLVADDGTFEEGLSVSKSLVLLLEVRALGSPVFSLTVLSFAEVVSGGNDLLSDLAQEIEDLNDLLVVDLGGELGQGGDEGLEEGVLGLAEAGGDLVESGFQLGESNTSLQVLNDLGGLINSDDVSIVFGILLFPGSVLLDAECGLGVEGLNVLVEILGGLTDLLLSLVESLGGVVTELGDSNDLGFVVVDCTLEVVDELFTGGGVVFVDLVSIGLLLVKLSSDILEEKVDLINTVTSCSSQMDQGQNGVTERALVDISQDLLGVLEFVLGSGCYKGNSKS